MCLCEHTFVQLWKWSRRHMHCVCMICICTYAKRHIGLFRILPPFDTPKDPKLCSGLPSHQALPYQAMDLKVKSASSLLQLEPGFRYGEWDLHIEWVHILNGFLVLSVILPIQDVKWLQVPGMREIPFGVSALSPRSPPGTLHV